MSSEVKVRIERVTIPTYRIGVPDKNPMFLEKRVYQGSSGAVYPHAVIDRVFEEKAPKEYTALFLENRYLEIMILPELGGRVQMALDKTNGYHFVYYNRVIKPALVGLAGPWISGGIEFNWPQHHRPSTFEPLDWRVDENPDGSRTVWCGEVERMFRTKGMHGFTLYPDRAYLEIRVQLYNRTAVPQTFLWWANPAVHVHEEYQSVFPPDVHAVMDHGKRDVSDFPIATGVYYKVDFAPGTDISRYKNIPVPMSYMADHSDFDFLGCYDHRARAGMMHVADHHIVPGKKQWTWGCGDFGRAWDRHLTDEDGPYIELMCGAYTDNQPDFSWIQPGEEKTFTQVFMPYKLIGPAVNASRDAVISLDIKDSRVRFGIYVSRPRTVRVRLAHKGTRLFEKDVSLSPETTLLESVPFPAGGRPQDLTLSVRDGDTALVSFTPLPETITVVPAPARAARDPREIASNEELFLNGLHLEQYRHATYSPESYYEEALRRDPLDSRCNNALGLLLYRRGKFAEAEAFFRKAVQRLTTRNPNPYDGEPFYNLGLALKMQGRSEEAFAAFYKAVWNAAWQDAAYFELARLASGRGDFERALALADLALARNSSHHQARHLKIALLRRAGQSAAAIEESRVALETDRMNYGALWERFLLVADPAFGQIVRGASDASVELALDYAQAGLWDEALDLLRRTPKPGTMEKYLEGWIAASAGRNDDALRLFREAATMLPDYVFPNRLEDVTALETAMRMNPGDPRAPYYLGNFWYAHRRYDEAVACWEKARVSDPRFPTVHRNLGLAYANKRGDIRAARLSLETAFALDPSDARVFFELDQLSRKLNVSPHERLVHLEKYPDLVEQRDDLTIERVTLLNILGRPDDASRLLAGRTFHPWEGGEGKVTGQYVTSAVAKARRAVQSGEYSKAVEILEGARVFPFNLGEGKLYGARENNIFYYLGGAHEGLGHADTARVFFDLAGAGPSEPASAMYYNDQPPDMIFYQGLALRKSGREEEAEGVFRRLAAYGRAHLEDDVKMDYFAVSLPDFLVFDEDLGRRNRVHCHYMMALGAAGLGDREAARREFEEVLSLDANHQGAAIHLRLLDEG
jgi:tetratricopeptide (TPR) repeat protein